MSLPVSIKHPVRFSRFADAAERIAEQVKAASIAVEEAKAAAAAPQPEGADGKKMAKDAKAKIKAAETHLADVTSRRDKLADAIAGLEKPEPVYLLRIPDILTRAAWRRDMVAAQVPTITRNDYLDAMREAVAEGFSDIATAGLDEIAAAFEAGEDLGQELQARWLDAFGTAQGSPAMARVIAAANYAAELRGYHALRHTLVGIEGGVEFYKKLGLASDETINAIPPADLAALQVRAVELFELSSAARGN